MWKQLCWMSEQKTLFAKLVGFTQLRRGSATDSYERRPELLRAEQALEIHWRGFMKTAADLLNVQPDETVTTAPTASWGDALRKSVTLTQERTRLKDVAPEARWAGLSGTRNKLLLLVSMFKFEGGNL